MTTTTRILSRYGVLGTVRLGLDVLTTKLLFPNCRLIRRPIYIRGFRNINFGTNLTTGVGLRLDAFTEDDHELITFGNNVQLNDYVHIGAVSNVHIGDDVLIASRVFISDHNHGIYNGGDCAHSSPLSPPADRQIDPRPVRICDRVWIGEGVCVMPGVTIGEGSVVGAGSIVTKSIPANCIIAGNHAKLIRQFDFATNAWKRV